jgi:hypothetical protein
MKNWAVLVGPSDTLSLRRLELTARARGFDNVLSLHVDLSNTVAAQEADLESCETLATILESEPHLVGFSCFYWNVLYFLKLANAIKSLRPSTLIVFGGPEATGDHERLLQRYPFIDAVVMGEGEESFCDLLARLQQNQPGEIHSWLPFVQGIAYRNKNGEILQSPTSRAVTLDELPSPVLGEDRPVSKGVLLWELARGCPFRCIYCFESRMHHGQRSLSLSLAEEELRAICRDSRIYLVRCLIPTFNLDEAYALGLLDLIEKYNRRGIRFQFELKPDLERPALYRRLRSMNDVQLAFGLQTTSQATSQVIRRHLDPLVAEKTFREFSSQWRNKAVVDLIGLLPGEGVSDFFDSLDQTIAWLPHTIMCFPLRVLPGTELWGRSEELGLLHSETPPYAIFGSKRLTPREVVFLKQAMAVMGVVGHNMALISLLASLAKEFGLRPSSILRQAVAELENDRGHPALWLDDNVWEGNVSPRATEATTQAIGAAAVSCLEKIGGLNPQQSGRLLEVVRFCEDTGSLRILLAAFDSGASDLEQKGDLPAKDVPKGPLSLTGTINLYGASLYRWIADRTTSLKEILDIPGDTYFFIARETGAALDSQLAEWLELFAGDKTFDEAALEFAQQNSDDAQLGARLQRWTHWALASGLLKERQGIRGETSLWDQRLLLNGQLVISASGPDSFLVEDSRERRNYLDLNSNALVVLSFFSGGKTPRQVFEAVRDQMDASESDFVQSLDQFLGSGMLVAAKPVVD